MPKFEVFDTKTVSALNRIIHNFHLKKRISLEEQEAQKQDRFLCDKQIAYLIWEHFRVTGANDSVENYADLFTIVLRNDDLQEFFSKWDGILLPMTKIQSDEILQVLHKLGTRETENFKAVLELYNNLEIPSEEVRTWLSPIETYGEKQYRTKFEKQVIWSLKRKQSATLFWSRLKDLCISVYGDQPSQTIPTERKFMQRAVKSIHPTVENWLRKHYKYTMKNDTSTKDEHETNHINNKCNDMNMNTRKMHNTWAWTESP